MGIPVTAQCAGPRYQDGVSAAACRSDKGAARFGLFVDRDAVTAEDCSEQPLGEVTDEQVTCEQDGDAWYRTAGGSPAYAVPRDGVVIRLIADVDKADRAVLRQAAEAVHRPDDAEPAALLPACADTDSRFSLIILTRPTPLCCMGVGRSTQVSRWSWSA